MTLNGRLVVRSSKLLALVVLFTILRCGTSHAAYTNFEASQVHPLTLTPGKTRLLAVNTPDSQLEVFQLDSVGRLVHQASIPVGIEPVSVRARTDSEFWVVNWLSDSISIVDFTSRSVVRTLDVGDEPTDVVFAGGRAFVSVSQEDRVRVFNLADLSAPPVSIDLFGRNPRALAVSPDGSKVYSVVQKSGNETTVIKQSVIDANNSGLRQDIRLELGLNDLTCSGSPPPYPPLPSGIVRNPALIDPPDGRPRVGLIVRWNRQLNRWEDDAGQNWTHCVNYRLPDNDLFVIDVASLSVSSVSHLGTTLFEVSVNPVTGKIYVPNTEARNTVRFEHPLGVRGHVVDNRLSIVDPLLGNSLTILDLNAHINRASDPAGNAAERVVSISQPGMMTWSDDGSYAFMTAIGSRRVFRLDGSCQTSGCLFGASRAAPNAVDVGNGPTGVALHDALHRLYVLNRIDNTIVTVDTTNLQKLSERKLLDPSPAVVKAGRILFYDGFKTSAHGDASCASCHISGDTDGLGWDLGDPTGSLSLYTNPGSNLRFIQQNPLTNDTDDCTPFCADHRGFDPQKGPMTTQTMRGMIEPLHWRGDRATLNAFNPAFVGLLGKQDIGPINGKPAGLIESDMEQMRQFLLGLRFPPNPHRTVTDTIPNQILQIPGHTVTGNPFAGEQVFLTAQTDGLTSCVACHKTPFGTNLGKLGGIAAGDTPRPAWAGLLRGLRVQSVHSDMKVPQLRNMYTKFGPVIGTPAAPAQTKSGFGFSHDGSIPDLATFFAAGPFSVNAAQVRDVSTFLFYWPSGTKPAVGRQVTVPAGTPPTGTASDESLLATLVSLGEMTAPTRHCELTASARVGGVEKAFRLSGGSWIPDLNVELPLTLASLRTNAEGPITFTCVPIDSGRRLGGDRDEDNVLNRDDCAPHDPAIMGPPQEVAGVTVDKSSQLVVLHWIDLSAQAGDSVIYDILGGSLSQMSATGLSSTVCIATDVVVPDFVDNGPLPAAGDGVYYLIRATNACLGTLGVGRESLAALICSGGGSQTAPGSNSRGDSSPSLP